MEYRTLGRSGAAVSTYALGTMTFGNETDEAGSHAQLDLFLEAGGTLVDTADVYTAGASEEIIGRWLDDRPADVTDRVVLATKGRFAMGDDANDVGLSRRHLTRALDASLDRLRVDCVDLYQVHAWDPLTPIEETLALLRRRRARRQGALRRAVELHRLAGPEGRGRRRGPAPAAAGDPAAAVQPAGPRDRVGDRPRLRRERPRPAARGRRSAAAGSPGKYTRDQRPAARPGWARTPTAGVEAYDKRAASERTWAVVDAVQGVAEARGASMAAVALAWLHDRPAVASVILGARTTEQLTANLAAAGLHLSPEEVARLDAASDPAPADYPYGPAGREQRERSL